MLGRAGRFSSGLARTRQLEFARRHQLLIALLFLFIIALTAVGSLAVPITLRPYFLGVGLASAVWTPLLLIVIATGTSSQIVAAWAAQWTSDVLRQFRGVGWEVVDELRFVRLGSAFDIDHTLYGGGGVFVLETKWSFGDWRWRDGRRTPALERDIEQARRNAVDLRLRLIAAPHHVRVPVQIAVVLWGEESEKIPTPQTFGDVTVVPGHCLGEWVSQLPRTGLDSQTVDEIRKALATYAQNTEEHYRAAGRFVDAGIRGVSIDLVGGVTGGCLAVVGSTVLWQASQQLLLDGLIAILFVGGGLAVARHIRILRPAAIGWIAGSIGAVLAVGALTLFTLLAH